MNEQLLELQRGLLERAHIIGLESLSACRIIILGIQENNKQHAKLPAFVNIADMITPFKPILSLLHVRPTPSGPSLEHPPSSASSSKNLFKRAAQLSSMGPSLLKRRYAKIEMIWTVFSAQASDSRWVQPGVSILFQTGPVLPSSFLNHACLNNNHC